LVVAEAPSHRSRVALLPLLCAERRELGIRRRSGADDWCIVVAYVSRGVAGS
jgi:hypothetical protein